MSTCVIKFDPRTIYSETFVLDADERGVLFTLLLDMWCHEGHLEDNPTWNARRCGIRPSRLRKLFARLVAGKSLNVIDGRIYPGARLQGAMRRVGLTPEQRVRVMTEETACRYCGATEGPFDIDHIYPASRGGTNHRRNLTLACFPCNSAKRDFTLRELAGLDG